MDIDPRPVHELTRDPADGMNPQTLTTGMYGARGERIRHVVHEGALRLPTEALDLIQVDLLAEQQYSLPSLDSVVRPSLDPKLEKITVTDIYQVLMPGDEMRPPMMRTVAQNRVIKKQPEGDPERIRGGGDGDEEESKPAATEPESVSHDPASASNIGAQTTSATDAPTPAPASATLQGTEQAAHVDQAGSSSAQPMTSEPDQEQKNQTDAKGDEEQSQSDAKADQTEPVKNEGPSSEETKAPVPASVSSSVPAPAPPQVIGLDKKPAPQWEQHIPGPSDEMQVDPAAKTPKPDWYEADDVSALERTVLHEWFDGSAPHRTEESYKKAREAMIKMSDQMGNRYVTTTMARRSIPGDAGSLMRLHNFLTAYALINEDSMNDSAPTPLILQGESKAIWNDQLRGKLMKVVVEQSRKRPKLEDPDDSLAIDWNAVAEQVGQHVTATDCERQFLTMPINETERSITPDTTMSEQPKEGTDSSTKLELQQEIFQDVVDKSDPKVIDAVTKAAFEATDSLGQAQKAGIAGLVASQALEKARSEEDAVARILSEVVDLRMKTLENRMALMDDIEGLLEAERVALELERRDLYTARCRHWFGGA